ncbi:MAG: hypothetical protein J6N52_09920 [Clostridia bacterium]|nr:hypothetical protein [Clostridia bacterium]
MNVLTKRIFAVFTAIGSLITAFSASATYVSVDGVIPESGVLFSDDYEAFDKSKYASVYNSGVIKLEDMGNVMATKPELKNKVADAGFYINLNTLGYDSDYTTCIRKGQIVISQDVYVPSHNENGEFIEYDDSISTYSQYIMNYGLIEGAKPGTYGTAEWSRSGGIMFAVHYSNENPWISFNKIHTSSVSNRETGYVVDIEPDTWHNVECCIDYDNLKLSYYCDGEYVGDYAGADAKTAISDIYGIFQLQMNATGTFDEASGHPQIYFDNYNIKILKTDSFEIEVDGYGSNYVDLRSNYSIDKEYLQKLRADSVKLIAGEEEFPATFYELVSTDVIRFYFDTEIISNGIYNAVICNKTDSSTYIRSIYGNAFGSVKPGTELSFIPQEAEQEEYVDLINLSFDNDEDFATEEASAEFSKYTYVRSRIDEDYDFVEDAGNTYKYCSAEDDLKGGRLLKLDLLDSEGAGTDPDGVLRAMSAVRFPFENVQSVSSGNIYVDFDAAICDNANGGNKQTLRLLFGLDNALTGEQAYIFRNTEDKTAERWSNSSCFFGLSYWTNKIHALTYANQIYRTRMCDWQRENNGAKTDNQVMLINDGELHHYSLNIDITNKKYEFSVDGGTPTRVDYLPGGETAVKYNAFVMTLVDPNILKNGMAEIDNLKVSMPSSKTPNIESIKFYDLNNKEIPYSREMTSATSKISIKFNQPVAADKTNFVIDGMNENDYTVTYGVDSDGNNLKNVIDMNLINCLNQDSKYMLKVLSGTEMSDSGAAFGRDFTVGFTRADDGGINYILPVINMKAYKAEAHVMNFTNNAVSGCVTVVGYTETDGVSELCGVKYNTFVVEPYKVLNVISGSNADITSLLDAGAERIAVYVFDNTDNFKLNTCNFVDTDE